MTLMEEKLQEAGFRASPSFYKERRLEQKRKRQEYQRKKAERDRKK